MRSAVFETVKVCIQLISSILAILLNSFLIYIIITKSPKKMGNYRSLMCLFCGISILFAALDLIVRPNIYSRGSAFFMMTDLRGSYLSRDVAQLLIWALCGCCGSTIYGIAVHFVYRFFALERQGRLRYFKGAYQIIWFSIPIIGGLNWSFICCYFFPMSPQSSEYLEPIIKDNFNISVSQVSYSGAVFWPTGEIRLPDFNWRHGLGFLNCIVLMQISFFVIIIMGAKSRIKIKELLKQGESKYSRELQIQLYKALVVQTLIPVLFIFIPFGILFTCPLFMINCEFLSAPLTIIYAIYPALDPLPILFYIDIYRNATREIFCSKCKSNRVDVFTVGNESRNSTDNSI
ncbi:hypothetical protein CRE_20014 [Caenorhabditis remanei]|uniref:Serpentine receptor class r-10 n=1 Tax=Caenorhabditis remanei TaxID=31234 RepID=E3NCF1_CAERE|nr:hypothetical protein CRE_20014 [Caenorhabditis remanei]